MALSWRCCVFVNIVIFLHKNEYLSLDSTIHKIKAHHKKPIKTCHFASLILFLPQFIATE